MCNCWQRAAEISPPVWWGYLNNFGDIVVRLWLSPSKGVDCELCCALQEMAKGNKNIISVTTLIPALTRLEANQHAKRQLNANTKQQCKIEPETIEPRWQDIEI